MSILKSAGPVLGLKEVKCKHYAGLNHSGLTLEFTPSSTQMSTWQGSGMVSLQKVTKTFFRIHRISPKIVRRCPLRPRLFVVSLKPVEPAKAKSSN
jgi:hypothetical protein